MRVIGSLEAKYAHMHPAGGFAERAPYTEGVPNASAAWKVPRRPCFRHPSSQRSLWSLPMQELKVGRCGALRYARSASCLDAETRINGTHWRYIRGLFRRCAGRIDNHGGTGGGRPRRCGQPAFLSRKHLVDARRE